MERMMKRSFAVIVGGALLALSTSAAAGDAAAKSSAAKLSDAELDQITAGQATSVLFLFNPGKGPGPGEGERINPNGNHSTCINCAPLDVPRTSGLVTVVTPNGRVVGHPIRQSPF